MCGYTLRELLNHGRRYINWKFLNPLNIISDRGTAFTSKEIEDYCAKQEIKYSTISDWKIQFNNYNRSYETFLRIPDNMLQICGRCNEDDKFNDESIIRIWDVGRTWKNTDQKINNLIDEEFRNIFQENRDKFQLNAKEQMVEGQEKQRKTYNLRRREPKTYVVGDLVALKRIGTRSKLKSKFLGPYRVNKRNSKRPY